MKQSTKVFFNLIALIVSAGLLIVLNFAWYATNKTATAEGGLGVVGNDERIHFTDTLTATKYAVNQSVTKNTYATAGGDLSLTKSEVYSLATVDASSFKTDGTLYTRIDDTFASVTGGSYSDETEYYSYTVTTSFTDSEKPFKFLYVLPKERIDITVGYYMDDECDGASYRFKLYDMTGDSFELDDHYHYSTGAYKYKNLSLTDKAGNAATGFTADTGYTFFTSYAIDEDDTISSEKTLYTHTWDSDYEELYFTFSIGEDFTQYYNLVAQASESVGPLLSMLHFKIGSIFIILE